MLSCGTDAFSFLVQRPARSTLFPYTTLFRSRTATRRSRGSTRSLISGARFSWVLRGNRFLRVRSETISAKDRPEEHTSELQSQSNLVCGLLLEKKIGWRIRSNGK